MPTYASNRLQSKTGQVASEYILILVGVVLSVLTFEVATGGNLVKALGDGFAERLLVLTTILKLPI